ncbi:DUF6090 family protein [Robiginitalea sp. IMCC43444]|uniref:DUF6090 family protein n=1 Tax=Robiginitalea sp. IMCC43444 TaxID=3459121 RepID=UPI00404190D1
MLRFFRQIRQRLLTENKVSRYMLYAIGEILLVVIGILIALQINSWNEERIERKTERLYLDALKEEFEQNLAEAQRVIVTNRNNLDASLYLLEFTGVQTPKLTEKSFDSLLVVALATEVEYRPGMGTLNEMISTGNMAILSNKILRKKLAAWDGILTMIRSQENELSRFRFAIFDLINKKGNSRKSTFNAAGEILNLNSSRFDVSSFGLLQNFEFENYLTGYYLRGLILNNTNYSRLVEEINGILGLIDQEINLFDK